MSKIKAMLVALTMLMALPLASAQNVPTEATITTLGFPPVIEKIIVLPDSADPTHVIPGTQILPNPGTGNTESITEFWKYVIVSDPNGRGDIAAVSEYLINTTGFQGPETPTTKIISQAEWEQVLLDALHANLTDQAEYDALKYNLDPAKQQSYMFKVRNTLTNHDANGTYQVKFKAVDMGGATTIGIGTFEYVALKSLELDFASVNYGPVSVNIEKWISGDNIFTPAGDGRPTLKNQGNYKFQIRINASNMTGDSLGEKIIATYMSVEMLGQHVNNIIHVNTDTGLPEPGPGLLTPITLNGFLMPCTPTQISFDIKPPQGTAGDVYRGDITIAIV